MKHYHHHYIWSLVILASVVTCTIFFFQTAFFSSISQAFNDTFTHKLYYPYNYHDDSVVIVKIDDRSLDALKKSDIGILAFDKGVYAKVIEKLIEQYKIAAVGIDVVFANASILGESDEKKLQDTLKKYQDRVVIASRSDGNPFPLCLYGEALHGAIDALSSNRVRQFNVHYNTYGFQDYCNTQLVNPDNIGVIESLSYRTLEQSLPYLSPINSEVLGESLQNFKDRGKTFFLSYFSNGQRNIGTLGFQSYSLIDILEGKTHNDIGQKIDLERKIVLIGEVGTLLHDSHLTPIHNDIKMPGVEINANIIETLRQGRYMIEISYMNHTIIIIILGLFLTYMVIRFSLKISIWILLLLYLAILVSGIILFLSNVLLNMFYLLFSATILYISLYLYRYIILDKQKRSLKKQFSLYVSPDVVDDITLNPDSVILEGEEREMSIFFSDIIGFTSISESLSPHELLELLNEYFSEMTSIIQLYKGTLDKYIGDAVMCFFNAPVELKNHSYYACKTALEQQKRLKVLRKKWKSEGRKELEIRIGIHSGKAIHGNIGDPQSHVNYTVIGDNVNLASRLEAICKEYGISICVSENIFQSQKDVFHFREIDTLRVKGKTEQVKIYELLGSREYSIPEKAQEMFQEYARGLELYRNNNLIGAREIWSRNTLDIVSQKMAIRCDGLISGTALIQDGVFIMTHK